MQQPLAADARLLKHNKSTTEYDHIRPRYVRSIYSQSTCERDNATTSRRSSAATFSHHTGTWNTTSGAPRSCKTHVCPSLSTKLPRHGVAAAARKRARHALPANLNLFAFECMCEFEGEKQGSPSANAPATKSAGAT